jgi:hypothetical protein
MERPHDQPTSLVPTPPARIEDLKRLVERRCEVTAAYAYTVPVRHLLGTGVWEGPVHVFILKGHPTATRAFAWTLAGHTPEHHVALESRAVPEAAEAVRLALL